MPDFNIANLTDQPLNVALNSLIERTSMPELPRPYLGASAIGDDCARRIQYDWWCKPELAARVRRIFERGHFFEFRMREQLIEAGFKFIDQSGRPRVHGARRQFPRPRRRANSRRPGSA
jgi:hypothetical protein